MQEGRAQQDFAVTGNPEGVSEALGNQILAHRVALHVTVGLAGGGAQRLKRHGLGLGADQLVRAPPGVSPHVLPCERPTVIRSAGRTCHWASGGRRARTNLRANVHRSDHGSTLKLNIIPLSWCSAMWQ